MAKITDIRVRRAVAKARREGRASFVAPGGVSALGRSLKHGGYVGAVGGGYANATPSTAAENKAWVKKAKKRGTLPSGSASSKRPGGSTKGLAVSANLAARRYRKKGGK